MKVHAYRIAVVMAGSVCGFYAMTQALPWAMSPPAPKVVRTPVAQIKPLPKDLDALSRLSRELSPTQIAAMRARIAKDPGDTRTRALLMAATWYDRGDAEVKQTHYGQVVWFVANLPDAPILSEGELSVDKVLDARTYALLCDLYDEALAKRPKDVAVMANYAALTLISDKERAIGLLTEAARLDPKNPKRYERLAFAHVLASHRVFGGRDPAEASLAVDAYVKARALGSRGSDKYYLEAVFDSGREAVAEREAKTLLQKPDHADATHNAHTILGRLALRKGDIAAAKTHLLESAKVEGSPVLGSFGPSMDLARELLAKGERKPVLAYLTACGKFWEDERQARWMKTVADGGTPDWD